MRRGSEPRATARVWLLLGAVLLATGSMVALPAQVAPVAATQPGAAPSAGQPAAGGTFIDSRTAKSQNLARAEDEDDEYVFKHSAAVRSLGRMLHLSPEASSRIFWALNALILFAAIGYLLVTGVPKVLRERQQRLDRALVDAQKATEAAEARLRAIEERLGRLDAEIQAVREQAERDSAADEAHIREAMEEERKKILASAEQEIAAAGMAARRSLRQFAAELAVDRATSRLSLSEGDDRVLIQNFARSLAGDGREGGRN